MSDWGQSLYVGHLSQVAILLVGEPDRSGFRFSLVPSDRMSDWGQSPYVGHLSQVAILLVGEPGWDFAFRWFRA